MPLESYADFSEELVMIPDDVIRTQIRRVLIQIVLHGNGKLIAVAGFENVPCQPQVQTFEL